MFEMIDAMKKATGFEYKYTVVGRRCVTNETFVYVPASIPLPPTDFAVLTTPGIMSF